MSWTVVWTIGALLVAILAATGGWYTYVEIEEERLMRCVYNAALLRGGANAPESERATREAAEKARQTGMMSTLEAYRLVAAIAGCESP